MNHFAKLSFVFFLVSSLVFAQNNMLLAQTSVPAPSEQKASTGGMNYTGPESLGAVPALRISSNLTNSMMPPTSVSATLMASNTVPALPTAAMPAMPANASPATGGSSTKNIPIIVGLALTGVGIGLMAHAEPVHQTVCITYGICPVPGATHVAGAIMIGVGAPLAILSLVKH